MEKYQNVYFRRLFSHSLSAFFVVILAFVIYQETSSGIPFLKLNADSIQTYMWTGFGDTFSWTDPSNWLNGSIPTDGSDFTWRSPYYYGNPYLRTSMTLRNITAANSYNHIIIASNATLTVSGTVSTNVTFFINDGTLINNGTMLGADLQNYDDVENYGSMALTALYHDTGIAIIHNHEGGTITFLTGGTVDNWEGTIENSGTIINDATFTQSSSSAALQNYGTFTNNSTMTIGGPVWCTESAIMNYGTFNNNGTYIQNGAGNTLVNALNAQLNIFPGAAFNINLLGGGSTVTNSGQLCGDETCNGQDSTSNCPTDCGCDAGYTFNDLGGVGLDTCTSTCGDGFSVGAEICDDGNINNDDGCNSTCSAVESGYICPTPGQACSAICGDSVKKTSEACDDGNTTSNDGCSATCTIESGYSCPIAGQACSPICGDGMKMGSEVCDDANTTNGDGCNSTCAALESNYTCDTSSNPTVCEKNHGAAAANAQRQQNILEEKNSPDILNPPAEEVRVNPNENSMMNNASEPVKRSISIPFPAEGGGAVPFSLPEKRIPIPAASAITREVSIPKPTWFAIPNFRHQSPAPVAPQIRLPRSTNEIPTTLPAGWWRIRNVRARKALGK